MIRSACFRRDSDGTLVPTPRAGSGWGSDHMRGLAIGGALARASERAVAELGRDDLRPARWTLDLFRAVHMKPITASATVIRSSRRLCLVEAELHQEGQIRARASALFLRPDPDAEPTGILPPFVDHAAPDSDGDDYAGDVERLYRVPDGPWVAGRPPASHEPLHLWHFSIPVVEGEKVTPFQNVAAIADVANAVTNAGPEGLAFINADVSLVLGRQVVGPSVGLASSGRVESDGICAGSTIVFDRLGACGTATTTALSQPPIELRGSPMSWRGDRDQPE